VLCQLLEYKDTALKLKPTFRNIGVLDTILRDSPVYTASVIVMITTGGIWDTDMGLSMGPIADLPSLHSLPCKLNFLKSCFPKGIVLNYQHKPASNWNLYHCRPLVSNPMQFVDSWLQIAIWPLVERYWVVSEFHYSDEWHRNSDWCTIDNHAFPLLQKWLLLRYPIH